MSTLRAIWSLLDARRRRQAVRLQLLAIVMALFTVVGVAAVMPFFAVLADPGAIAQHALLARLQSLLGLADPRTFTLALGAAFVALVVVANLVNLFGMLAMARFGYELGDDIHVALLDEYLHRDHLFHARQGAARLYDRVLYSSVRVAGGVVESALVAFANAVTIALIAAAVLVINPLVALGAIVWIGGGYAAVYLLARRRLYRNGLGESERTSARSRVAADSLRGIREVLLYRRQGYFRTAFDAACRAISRHWLENFAIAQVPRHAIECLTVLGLVGVALYLGRAGAGVGSWVAQLSFMGFAAYRLLPAIQQLFAALVRVRTNLPAFEEIAGDLKTAFAARRTAPAAVQLEQWARRPQREIRFEGVSLQYTAERAAALREVSLAIPAGALCAIVGPNGSGKSTLVDVLLGLLPPTAGELRVDGERIDQGNRAAWQAQLAYVPQDIVIFDATLAANVALGVPESQIDAARLQRALRGARLEALVAALPRGVREPLLDRGIALSGGQRQRIGIARALYRDAPVLVLDEATSALDGLTEAEVLDLLCELRGTRTIVFVAHRGDAVRRCDLVFELDAGRLVGTVDARAAHDAAGVRA